MNNTTEQAPFTQEELHTILQSLPMASAVKLNEQGRGDALSVVVEKNGDAYIVSSYVSSFTDFQTKDVTLGYYNVSILKAYDHIDL